MQEKKHSGGKISLPGLRSTVTEILVANGRSFQPFIRTFNYTGENIAKSNLGSLIGVFEIDELNEDCAYIVNFLASVAKKEYFNNPRRGAIESFEAALHKINLALSELVKHGNITWLGKLHGALAVLEKNNLHFSVTGKAKILLLRNDGLSDISDGLASPESPTHPIKTFVEVSSGRLELKDRVILTSPELLALFSTDDLVKNIRRMDHDRFTQFLKTALINELDLAGTLLVEVEEGISLPVSKPSRKPTEKKSMENIQNIFSQAAFLKEKSGTLSASKSISEDLTHADKQAAEEMKEEYTDTKTGHIYVQGDIAEKPGQYLAFERLKLKLEEVPDTIRRLLLTQGKWMRKGKKQFFITANILDEKGRTFGKKTGRILRRLWKKQQASLKDALIKKEVTVSMTASKTLDRKEKSSLFSITSLEGKEGVAPGQPESYLKSETPSTPIAPPEQDARLPQFMKEKVAFFYQKQTSTTLISKTPTTPKSHLLSPPHTKNFIIMASASMKKLLGQIQLVLSRLSLKEKIRTFSSNTLNPLFQRFRLYQKNLSVNQKRILLGSLSAFICFALLGFLFLKPKTTPLTRPSETSQQESTPTTALTPSSADAPSGEISIVLNNITDPIITSAVLGDETYIITEKSIITLTDKKSFPLPLGERPQFATVMDDLRLLFIYTAEGKLYAWSPISKTFVENTLTLNAGAQVTGIGTYLTYLYVLDSRNGQVYRFPRAEGGFGVGTVWLKETLPLEVTSHLTVNESLFISPDSGTIKGFFRGRNVNTFEVPTDGLQVTDLYTHSGLQNVYALDAKHDHILIWNQDGKLIKTITHEKLSDGESLSVNEKNGVIFISTENSLLSFKLE